MEDKLKEIKHSRRYCLVNWNQVDWMIETIEQQREKIETIDFAARIVSEATERADRYEQALNRIASLKNDFLNESKVYNSKLIEIAQNALIETE